MPFLLIILYLLFLPQIAWSQSEEKNTLNGSKSDLIKDNKAPISLKWLQLPSETLKNWQVTLDNNAPGVMSIKFIGKREPQHIQKKILILLPKKSASYVLATEKFLNVMHLNLIDADITLIHFNKDIHRGKAALAKAESMQADLIFSIGSETAALVHQFFQNKSIPVVTSTNKDPVQLGFTDHYKQGSGHNIAYTSLNIPTDVQMNYLFTLRPKLKVIGLLYNKNHKQVMATEVLPLKKKLSELGLKVIDIAVSSRNTAHQDILDKMPEAMTDMAKIDPGYNNSLLWITSSTAAFTQIDTINQFSKQVPVLGSIPNIVKEGDDSAVLAIGIDRRNNAYLASLYAVKILTGQADAGELSVGVVTPPDIAINFRIAKKIGLRIPFQFFESASFIYNYEGKPARLFGQKVSSQEKQ
ncbi:MAG: hypothetical protein GY694_18875 [Gammaproteobacteria bacterium]|nr:hypothetical protein [Gammaproteobacteria bacterium]